MGVREGVERERGDGERERGVHGERVSGGRRETERQTDKQTEMGWEESERE